MIISTFILFSLIISFLLLFVSFSINIFLCAKYKFFNFSNFCLVSSSNFLFSNKLSISLIFCSNSVNDVIFSGCSSGINISSSSSSSSSSVSSSFSSFSFISFWVKKSIIASFSSNNFNNFIFSDKNILLFPLLSSSIACIALIIAPIVCNK